MSDWETGTAKVIRAKDNYVYVACPFCPAVHAHTAAAMGTKSCIAGCHAPPHRLREYAISDPKSKKRNRR